jgi:hypothetical protein
MNLEARNEDCCSHTFVLKINGQAVGKLEGRWFSEGLDVALTGQRRFKFENKNWLSSHFQMKDAESEVVLADAKPAGFFSSAWNLNLSVGEAQFKKAGFWKSAWDVIQGTTKLATIDRLGMCERGWLLQNLSDLPASDVLLIGLVYQLIQARAQRAAAAAAAHGS